MKKNEKIVMKKQKVNLVSDCPKDDNDFRAIFHCKYGLSDEVVVDGDIFFITGIEITPYLIIYNGCNNDGFEHCFTQDEVELLYG